MLLTITCPTYVTASAASMYGSGSNHVVRERLQPDEYKHKQKPKHGLRGAMDCNFDSFVQRTEAKDTKEQTPSPPATPASPTPQASGTSPPFIKIARNAHPHPYLSHRLRSLRLRRIIGDVVVVHPVLLSSTSRARSLAFSQRNFSR